MAEGQKATQLAECEVTSGSLDLSLKPEAISFSSPNFEEPVSMPSPSRPQPPGLLSMPCLLKELRQDSPPEAVPPQKGPSTSVIQICLQEDSDSSACLRSPSSSGHLGDSDTLSSLEEDVGLADAKPAPSSQSEPARRKSSRRSRSESDASAGVAMVAKKNRCQERQPNGGRNRERGKRSQRHKERIRLLRQKREAVAKRKSRPLEDSSTSDSDATAHSSSSPSSSSDEGDTVRLHPPAGRRGNSMGGVLEEALTRMAAAQRRTEERFRAWMERISRLHSGEDDDQSCSGNPEGQSRVGSEEAPAAYRIIRLNNDAPPSTLNSARSCVLDPNLLNV